jgi:hypothetical protein
MSQEALLPCFKCGRTLRNVLPTETDNQPYEGTMFATEGHYGSTFWDSFDGEEIVINICDPCLRAHTQRIAQHKRYLPVRCEGMVGFGRQWVDRPMVPYTGHPDSGEIVVEPEELGRISQVEWVADIDEARQALMEQVGL